MFIEELPRLGSAVQELAFELFDSLDPENKHTKARNDVEDRIWRSARRPDDPYYFGEVHAKDDVERLLEALEAHDRDYLKAAEMFNDLPEEVLFSILRYLSPEDLARVAQVNKQLHRIATDIQLWSRLFPREEIIPGLFQTGPLLWKRHEDGTIRRLASDDVSWIACLDDLRAVFQGLNYIGPEFWAAQGIEVADVPPPDFSRILPVIQDLIRRVENGAGVTVMNLPSMSFDELMAFAREKEVPFDYVWDRISKEIGEKRTEAGWYVLSNSVLTGTRSQSSSNQRQLLEESRYQMPGVVHAMMLPIATWLLSGRRVRLLSDAPLTYTCCLERVGGYSLIVGGFTLGGLCVNINYYDFDYASNGAVALRKF